MFWTYIIQKTTALMSVSPPDFSDEQQRLISLYETTEDKDAFIADHPGSEETIFRYLEFQSRQEKFDAPAPAPTFSQADFSFNKEQQTLIDYYCRLRDADKPKFFNQCSQANQVTIGQFRSFLETGKPKKEDQKELADDDHELSSEEEEADRDIFVKLCTLPKQDLDSGLKALETLCKGETVEQRLHATIMAYYKLWALCSRTEIDERLDKATTYQQRCNVLNNLVQDPESLRKIIKYLKDLQELLLKIAQQLGLEHGELKIFSELKIFTEEFPLYRLFYWPTWQPVPGLSDSWKILNILWKGYNLVPILGD